MKISKKRPFNTPEYYLGIDIGSSKSHALLADETGNVLGFSPGGPANPDNVGHAGMLRVMEHILSESTKQAGLSRGAISGAGFGISGFDWPQTKPHLLKTIEKLELSCPVEVVNDALLGLMAGTEEGWGVAVVAGTGCNAWGWNHDRSQVGRVTGGGMEMGETGGAAELVFKAVQTVSQAWSMMGPETSLTSSFVGHCGAKGHADLLYGLMSGKYQISASAAPLVFEAAHGGDTVALNLIKAAGHALGEMTKAVIRQLDISGEPFDIVQIGSMFNGGPWLSDAMWENVQPFASKSRLVRLDVPPVLGALILGSEATGISYSPTFRNQLKSSFGKNQSKTLRS